MHRPVSVCRPPARILPAHPHLRPARIYHLGFLVGNSQQSIAFYHDVLGFTETWRGGANPAELSWINMKVPDGDDYVEFMLYRDKPSKFGTKNHISLVVPDINKAVAELQSRPYFKTYGKDLTIATGVNQKRQVNMYDPDLTFASPARSPSPSPSPAGPPRPPPRRHRRPHTTFNVGAPPSRLLRRGSSKTPKHHGDPRA